MTRASNAIQMCRHIRHISCENNNNDDNDSIDEANNCSQTPIRACIDDFPFPFIRIVFIAFCFSTANLVEELIQHRLKIEKVIGKKLSAKYAGQMRQIKSYGIITVL